MPNEDRYIWQLLPKETRRSTASDLSRQLSSATGTTVSRQTTVYRRLGHIGLYARRPVRCVPLTVPKMAQFNIVGIGATDYPNMKSARYPLPTLNDTVTVVQDGSFGEELFLVPELTCMFRV
ncbi:HTH_Tnp_Tc3_2 domain-containing protein [Trichonephila clavipes]|nr:HTH_Tnp_Tc3_2 domain-containing protein [Trichonephila clavipes]